MVMMKIRVAATALAVLIAGVVPGMADDYPSRPITMVVPFAAGGPTDVVARIMAEGMRASLGQTILIENGLHPGSGSQIAVKFVVSSKGEIPRISVAYRSPGVPDVIGRACINAVTSRAPFGRWTPEMVAALGSEQELTFFFSYQ